MLDIDFPRLNAGGYGSYVGYADVHRRMTSIQRLGLPRLVTAPRLRQPVRRHLRHIDAVVRRVVEQRQARRHHVFEVENVERARALVESVAIFAWIESD